MLLTLFVHAHVFVCVCGGLMGFGTFACVPMLTYFANTIHTHIYVYVCIYVYTYDNTHMCIDMYVCACAGKIGEHWHISKRTKYIHICIYTHFM